MSASRLLRGTVLTERYIQSKQCLHYLVLDTSRDQALDLLGAMEDDLVRHILHCIPRS
jgi:hypothetical protein